MIDEKSNEIKEGSEVKVISTKFRFVTRERKSLVTLKLKSN
jgi:hypothetical protein